MCQFYTSITITKMYKILNLCKVAQVSYSVNFTQLYILYLLFENIETFQLRPDEIDRKNRILESNRRSAAKCRRKVKDKREENSKVKNILIS